METAFYGNPGGLSFQEGFLRFVMPHCEDCYFFFQRGGKERKGFYHYHMFFSIVYSFLMRFLLFFGHGWL